MTASHWVQFTVGRIIAYFAVGLVENAVPCYNGETSPAATRGLLSGSIMMVTSLGNLWGAGISRAYATTQTNKGWMVPTAMQFIPAIGLLALVPFTPESPRWLILKGRKQNAKCALDKIRPKQDAQSGATAAEVDAIEQLVEESLANEKGSWLELFRGNYLRRIWVSGRRAPTQSVRVADVVHLDLCHLIRARADQWQPIRAIIRSYLLCSTGSWGHVVHVHHDRTGSGCGRMRPWYPLYRHYRPSSTLHLW